MLGKSDYLAISIDAYDKIQHSKTLRRYKSDSFLHSVPKVGARVPFFLFSINDLHFSLLSAHRFFALYRCFSNASVIALFDLFANEQQFIRSKRCFLLNMFFFILKFSILFIEPNVEHSNCRRNIQITVNCLEWDISIFIYLFHVL